MRNKFRQNYLAIIDINTCRGLHIDRPSIPERNPYMHIATTVRINTNKENNAQ